MSAILGFQKVLDSSPIWLVGTGSAIVATGVISAYTVQKVRLFSETKRLKKVVKRKQAERQAAFAELKAKYGLTEERSQILDWTTDELTEKLQSREVTAKAVLEAFIAKSLEVTEQLNCITEYIPQSLKWAEELDSLPSVKGPLHGIPFCVKDDHDVEGMDSTLGYAKFLYKPAAESAAIVKVLQELGGVPFCKTNVPMSLFSNAAENPIFGTTINAQFPERHMSPAGSSSGTAALVAAGGAPFGLGSDLGGSVRVPAHCNGIAGIRPTFGRFCHKGVGVQFQPGCVGLHCLSGILARVPKDVTLVVKSMIEGDHQRKYDGTVVPVPWNAKIHSSNSLRIGYYTSISTFPALGSTEKTILSAKDALENKGHVLVPFEVPSDAELHWNKLFIDLCCADLGQHLRHLQYGEQYSPAMANLWMTNVPVWLRHLGASILQWIPGCTEFTQSLRTGVDAATGSKLWNCMVQRDKIFEQVLLSMSNLELDAIIGPTFPHAAIKTEDNLRPGLFVAGSYTWFWSLVDMPTGTVRFGTETGTEIAPEEQGSAPWKFAKNAIKQSIEMPIGVQVIGKKFEEEVVLKVMLELDEIYQLDAV